MAGRTKISKIFQRNLSRRNGFTSADARQTIAQRFEQQTRRYPHRLALKLGVRSLSYAELNSAANRVARATIGRDRFPTETIAVYCGGLSMIVASLAVLKAGKAFVPLNPQLPASALKQILAGFDDCAVLTDDSHQAAALKIVGAAGRLLNVERVDCKLSPRNLKLAVSPDAVAYINFTSGTTGEPKGVVWNHRSELFGIKTKTASLKITAEDRISLVRSNNVGAARDMFLALLNGAALVVLDLDAGGLASLGNWLREEKITVFTCVATLFRQAANGAGAKGFPAVRLIHIGGEPVFKSDVELYRKYFSDRCRLVCRYSISETQAVSYYFIDKKTRIDGERVPVGYPLPGSDVLMLGDDGREVAPGGAGEIAVRSPYLALGYWRQPELTRAKFIGEPGDPARMYRTGDFGIRRADGCLLHLGRKDSQAKVQGYRVELGAVEGALNALSSIDHAAVIAEPDAARGSRLVAHVVPKKQSSANIQTWRRELKTRLPPFMIPQRFVVLRKLPLNTGGKVDRSALLAVGSKGRGAKAPVAEPRSAVEKVLARFWRTVLDLDRVGISDDWAGLGGDSLAAAQFVAKVSGLFPLDAADASLFELSSIAEAARFIVDHELQMGQAEKIAAAYLAVEQMSDDEVDRRLDAYGDAGEKMAESRARRELLAKLLGKEGIALPAQQASAPSGEKVLSFAQERLWFLDQLQPESAVYHIARALRLRGPLNRRALARAVDVIVDRHEILRAAFPSVDDRPPLRITTKAGASLELLDWRGQARASRAAEIARRLGAEAVAPFDLARGPLFRAKLIALGKSDHVLLVVMHQMIFDGGSMSLFLGELVHLYRASADGKIPELPALSMQYADYAARERRLFNGAEMRRQLAYWKERLSRSAEGLALPADHLRPRVQSFRGARLPLMVPETTARRLKALGAGCGATPFVVWMAIFNVLLRGYSGQEELSVGFAAARRPGDAEKLIGPFVNTLVLRVDFSRDLSFRDLLGEIRAQVRAALAHQDAPFDRLVEELGGERDLSRNPLFQAMFVYRNYPADEFRARGLRVESIELPGTTAKFDLMLSLTERGGGPRGFIEYSTDLFEAPTIERLARHFLVLAASAAAHPDEAVSRLRMLSEQERKQIVVDWNRTASRYPKNHCVHEFFEAQAARTPRALAVECGGDRLTYGELERRANRLAHHLRALGAKPDQRIGVCLPRSLDLIVALLGILKSGAAYVPLDPAHPRERLRFMLEDAGVSVLLTAQTVVEDGGWRMEHGDPPSSIFHPRVVHLDRDAELIARRSAKKLKTIARPANLAYVIYTSGSTGQPKGVAIEHRNAVAFLHWAKGIFSPRELAGVLASTSVCFDLSVYEIFAPLGCGGRVILVENALAIQNLPQDAGVTLINTVPSAMAELLDLGTLPASVGTVNLAGEPLQTELVRRIYESGSVEKVYDLYGPSETTTYSTFTLRSREGRATIGRPIANTRVYLLDGVRQPVAVGVTGEIFIGGAGVARGYLNRPALTAEKFVRNPFVRVRGARMYRTGDLARYDAGGNIEYLGRADQQVKLRGYRIELGEIEAALRLHGAVRECVVVAREGGMDEADLSENPKSKIQNPKSYRRPIAYVVFNESTAPSHVELRNFLRTKLPEYMVPALFVRLDALPLNPNGKLDRNALRPPDGSPGSADGFVAPRTEIEELIAQIWREVLKVERVGAHDNFFELGGHSLLAVRAVGRLRARFKIELPLRSFFELPTVAQLAPEIEYLRGQRSGSASAPILPVPRHSTMPLSFAQRRVWFLHKIDPELTAYNMPSGHRLKGPLNIAALESALNEMVRRHEALRTVIVEADGEPVQRIDPKARLKLRLIDVARIKSRKVDEEAARILNDDALRPFDLARAPLMRASLLRFAAEDHALILNFHHLIADGGSSAIIFRELGSLYASALVGRPSTLPAPPIQYADFAEWQRGWLAGDSATAQLDYWRRQLAGFRALELPADCARPALQSYRGIRAARRLPQELSGSLKRLGRARGATLFMTLLAAVKILVARLSGQEDVVIGTTVAGRNRAELENVIGFFINVLPLRTDLSGSPTFVELLDRVREVCLAAYTHQDLPFERIVEAINPVRDPGRNPIFPVLFNMADVTERSLKLAGCETTSFSQTAPGAKFDLVLRVPENLGGLDLEILYNADLFSAARIATFLEQWEAILAQAVAAPEKKLDRFSLWKETTQAVLPDPTAPLDDCWLGPIGDFVSRQAKARGAKIAVADGREAWRYRELDEVSNRLARRLIAEGAKPGDTVAIYAQRDASLVLALLATLRAGAVFVVLDPSYPPARLIEYVRIARPKGWICMMDAPKAPVKLEAFLHSESNWRIDLPRERKKLTRLLKRHSAKAPALSITADDPAYIAFTSGSTGQPKGVLCRHGPITHFLPWQEEAFALRRSDRYSFLSGLGYNHLQRELFTALAAGATVCIPGAEAMASPAKLLAWLRAEKISIIHLTPALGRLLSTARGKVLPSARRIFFGGDLLTGADVAAAVALAPEAVISNFYGATETQRAVGCFIVDPSARNPDTIPAGRGVKDAQLLVLSADGRQAGIGELGEIYVRSPHLAAGYVGDEALARRNFVVNPFTGAARDRLYRTCELGRYLPDGNVQWAGRSDRRINVRGFRVELAEIEVALGRCAGVRQAAVTALDIERGADKESAIVAFVERKESDRVDGNELRERLKATLPHYMIPEQFHFVARLPLNLNGKIDYARLPEIESFATAERKFESPRSATERAIAAAFAAVLGVARIGRRDNFFELGGHSLLAAQTAARIRDLLGIEPDLKSFLQAPTPAALAQRIDETVSTPKSHARAEIEEREEIEV